MNKVHSRQPISRGAWPWMPDVRVLAPKSLRDLAYILAYEKKLFLLIIPCTFLFMQQTGAQPKPTINHIALYVIDLKKSAPFYQDIIGLDTIPEPFRDGKHTWFSIGPKSHLHLIEGAKEKLPHPKNNHICFTVPSVEEFVKRLTKHQIEFEDLRGTKGAITTRVDGVKQIYFKDPDDYWIEINDAKE
jgi:lactoylglutathione lyase